MLALASLASATELYGQVVGIADGDTLTFLVGTTQHRIRLDLIDAPERTQPYSQIAGKSLADLAHRKQAAADCHKLDKYARDVCRVLINGADINLEQIRRGLAWHFKGYAHEQSTGDRAAYARAEEDARVARRGMWASPSPQMPLWEFRAAKATQASAAAGSTRRPGLGY
jgi:endonuclease YncB( thermonuclease family)